ncbi:MULTISPECIES: response regulator transcription factor [Megasphaera]|uniref:Putative oxygen regulatory protein NreC n=1 Tax=Megasphaera vaginalis (ex Srinivasan et al. 2021) TaxID=1111454 RepID=U7UJY7_9FIRM|nr:MULTISPECIES: response regulator transcription factor [Megasphaera]ERT58788.1 putative oxygen regulatory protein NreC [Megasphaera vaginalis (ex Srinivasan et al. 2021)]
MNKLRILLADDHRVLRTGLKLLLQSQPDFTVVAEASDGKEVLSLLETEEIDVILLDLSMPGMGGLECLNRIRSAGNPVKIIILTMYSEQQYVKEVMMQGADGYLCKDTLDTELFAALHSIAGGKRYLGEKATAALVESLSAEKPPALSQRELEVLTLIARGNSLSAIAERLYLSVKTVSTYKTRLMRKLNCTTNAELVDYALKRHLLH